MAATIDKVIAEVTSFAQSNTFTASPNSMDDTIVPAPGAMNDDTFQRFFEALAAAVGAGGIQTNLPFQGVRDSTKWIHIVNCVLFNQVGA